MHQVMHELTELVVVGKSGALGGVCTGLFCAVAAMAADAAPFSPGLAPRSPEIMLYFSHAIGGGAGGGGGPMRRTFGLRVQQIRQGANTGDPADGGDAMQHRELVNWQMEAHSNLHLSDLRVKLGNKVTYDVTNRRFGSPSDRSAMQIGIPSLRNGTPSTAQPRPVFAGNTSGVLRSPPASHDSNRDNSNIREIAAAAMAALAPSHFTSVQRPTTQRQGGIAGVVAVQRMQGARGGFANAN
jgi:hypothetical protein